MRGGLFPEGGVRWSAVLVLLWSLCSGCEAETVPPAEPKPAVVPEDPADPEVVEIAATGAPERELHLEVGDLDTIVASGKLRVLTMGSAEVVLPRAGPSSNLDLELAARFAESLGLTIEPVGVDKYEDLIPWLLEGKGDLIASRMAVTPSRAQRVAFSRPTSVVSELLVGKTGTPDLPRGPEDLAGRTVTVRLSSSFYDSLQALKVAPTIAAAPEDRDTESLVHDVSAGTLPLTVADSDLFEHIAAYNPDAQALFPIATGRQIAWAIRPSNPKLKAAADAFLISQVMTDHARVASTGDLDALKKRGSLRVLTRNNAVSYFLHQGTQRGFDYELIKMFAKENGLRLDVVVPPHAKDLIPWLLEGKGDVIAAQMAITEERQEKIAFSEPYLFVDEVLVQSASEPPLTSLEQLRGKTLVVRKSSSYRSTLDVLQKTHGPFTIVDADEEIETEQLVAMVGRGEIPMTVADSTIAHNELTHRSDIQISLSLTDEDPIAFGLRKENAALAKALDTFVQQHYRKLDYNVIRQRYFESAQTAEFAQDMQKTGQLSPYDELLKLRSEQYGLDWRLMASQAYQESRFDPAAKSWSGALGLFQVMPRTGAELGFTELHDPDQGVHAGVKYMAKLIDQFDKDLPFKQRVRFALASYNVGKGHVEDARRLAVKMGLNPDKWFGHVEKAMLRLADPKVARTTKYGYCRAEEPVHYVSEIQTRYESYLALIKDLGPATPER
jgi:membrane-bound lytic murein transglycosylase F